MGALPQWSRPQGKRTALEGEEDPVVPAHHTPQPKAQVTIEDVAKAAGVSRGTVSRVLNGGYSSAASREKVRAAITATGYRANMHARSLASGRSNVYAAVLTEPYGELFDDPTFGIMLQGIGSELIGTDIALNLLFATTDEERERTLAQLAPGRADGVILLSPHINDPLLAALTTELPTVVCGPLEAPRPNTWTITIDDRQGGILGAQHIVERGARHVAIIAGPAEAQGAHHRVSGQIDTLGAAFETQALRHAPYSQAGGAEAMRALLDSSLPIDGVLCGSDRQALGAMSVLRERGLRVPEDIKVVGFDNHTMATTSTPPLTTVSQPIFEVGAQGARTLHSLMAGTEVTDVVLPTSLVVRSTT